MQHRQNIENWSKRRIIDIVRIGGPLIRLHLNIGSTLFQLGFDIDMMSTEYRFGVASRLIFYDGMRSRTGLELLSKSRIQNLEILA